MVVRSFFLSPLKGHMVSVYQSTNWANRTFIRSHLLSSSPIDLPFSGSFFLQSFEPSFHWYIEQWYLDRSPTTNDQPDFADQPPTAPATTNNHPTAQTTSFKQFSDLADHHSSDSDLRRLQLAHIFSLGQKFRGILASNLSYSALFDTFEDVSVHVSPRSSSVLVFRIKSVQLEDGLVLFTTVLHYSALFRSVQNFLVLFRTVWCGLLSALFEGFFAPLGCPTFDFTGSLLVLV